MVNNRLKGAVGENIAVKELVKKEYIILQTNYRRATGEIDIIAKKEEYTVFVEVKLRKNISNGLPKEAVDSRKQKKIIEVANQYIQENELFDNDFRFDVIEIMIQGKNVVLNHIENAFWL